MTWRSSTPSSSPILREPPGLRFWFCYDGCGVLKLLRWTGGLILLLNYVSPVDHYLLTGYWFLLVFVGFCWFLLVFAWNVSPSRTFAASGLVASWTGDAAVPHSCEGRLREISLMSVTCICSIWILALRDRNCCSHLSLTAKRDVCARVQERERERKKKIYHSKCVAGQHRGEACRHACKQIRAIEAWRQHE